MKSILISIQPQWVKKILNGEKTIEIRKTAPKCELPCKVYIYCTKLQKGFADNKDHNLYKTEKDGKITRCNGKVVAEFVLNDIEYYFDGENFFLIGDRQSACLTLHEILGYANNGPVYAWRINDLIIYNKPKELSEFRKDMDCDDYPCNKNRDCKYNYYDTSEGCWACGIDFDGTNCIYKQIKRPPQSWCYVEEL